MRAVRRLSRLFSFFTAAVILAAAPVGLHAAAHCHSAEIRHEVVLPDGSVHPPGHLQSCRLGTHSPNSSLLELSMDGRPIHFVIGRTREAEQPAVDDTPFFVFSRNDADQLVLEGYAVPRHGKLVTYRVDPSPEGVYRVSSHWSLRSGEAAGPGAVQQ